MTRQGLAVGAAAVLGLASGCSAVQLAWYGHTPDRTQVVEVQQRGDAQWLSIGARRSKPYRAIAVDDLAFDADGRRFAFAAELSERPERWTIVEDFVEGRTWEAVAGLRFGPRGGRLVYAGLEGGHWRLIVDGAPGPSFDAVDVDSIVFSPDGRRVAYVVQDGGCARAVFDGRAGDCVARVVGLAAGDVGARDVTVVDDGTGAHVCVGERRVFDLPNARSLSVDPAVEHWAVTTDSPDGQRLVVDGSAGDAFDAIGAVVWAPDGRAIAYTARRGRAWHVVAGGQASGPYGAVEEPVFAANGSHLGYLARDPERSVVAIDGRVVWESEAPATALTLSPDGARRAWMYRDGAKAVIAVDDQRYPFEVAIERTLRFSRDGRHWAALVGSLAERRLSVAVDGRPVAPFDAAELFGGSPRDVETHLASWVSAELELYLARAGSRS
jgi:hypothetical protein